MADVDTYAHEAEIEAEIEAAAEKDRTRYERSGWSILEDWDKLLLVPGTRIVACTPSRDGQAIFYKVK